MSREEFSDYIVYVDESGDHGMKSVDPGYPVFVLACCLFKKNAYVNRLVPALQAFKFEYFGHDGVVLHEADIRKQVGPFHILADSEVRETFMEDLSGQIENAPFEIVAVAIRKDRLKASGQPFGNLYHEAFSYCLEMLHQYLAEVGQEDRITHVVCEARGKREDRELELEFRRVRDGNNPTGARLPFEFVIANKQVNSSGLQLADLIAKPIGNFMIRPKQPNRAFNIIIGKLCKHPDTGDILGSGLKVIPEPRKNKRPPHTQKPVADQDNPNP